MIRELTRVVEIPESLAAKGTQVLGQMLVGKCAEVAFEQIYRDEMHSSEFALRDLREGRSDTDYRLYNGGGRPVYRINIKFHGSQFRRAAEFVGLEPTDCFALATYKIHGALQKQEQDELPFIFVIVGVPGLRADLVGAELPAVERAFVSLIHASNRIPGKRNYEDQIVEMLKAERHPAYIDTLDQIARADWFILSARRAHNLMRDKLFERVFALRVRNFARIFRGAELDMHFSLKGDLTPLRTYLKVLRESGYPRVTTLLERGEF